MSAPENPGVCRLLRQERAVEVRIEPQRPQVHAEDLLALLHVGQPHLDLAVEAPGAHQRLVEDVGTVGRRQHDHSLVGLESVHLGEQLVERIFAFVVARESGILAACAADGVDLVDEEDAGRLLLGLLEKVAHARGAHAHEHLHEVGTRHREERHVGLARHGLGQQRLARTRRAHQKGSFRNLGAQLLVFVGLAQEVHDLHDLYLGLLKARHVLERHALRLLLVEHLCAGLAHVHDAPARAAGTAARHRAHEQEPHADDEHPRQQIDQ